MTNSTWTILHSLPPAGSDYTNSNNWNSGVPTGNDTAFFVKSSVTNIDIPTVIDIGEWFFDTTPEQYSFTLGLNAAASFRGAGILVNGGGCNIDVKGSSAHVLFYNNSTAGSALITIESKIGDSLDFRDLSTAGSANIINMGTVHFSESSTAANAVIHTLVGGKTFFNNYSNGGNAQLNTDAGGKVDFSFSTGPNGDLKLTVGSIAGAGIYALGSDQLTVGLKGV